MWMEENLSDVMVCISALMAMMRMVVVSLLRSRADYTIGNITPVTSHAKNSHEGFFGSFNPHVKHPEVTT